MSCRVRTLVKLGSIILFACIVSTLSDTRLIQGHNQNLGEALQFLREYDSEASGMCFRVSSAQWRYSTNMTDYNKRRMIEEQMIRAKFEKLSWKKAITFDWTRLPDPMTRRQLKMLATNGRASLPDEKYNEIHHLISEMKEMYNSVRVCPYNNKDNRYCDLVLDPDVIRLMEHSRNPGELNHIWKEWHDKTGPPVKNKFMRYVQLANQAARMNGFSDAGEQMKHQYEDDHFEFELNETWEKLLPLYKELFTYVRKRLLGKYGSEYIREDGPLPAHLVGSISGQDWNGIADLMMPYPAVKNIDVTDELLRQGFTPLRIFQMAEEFFTSMGLKPMPPEFWRNSLLEKPVDRKVQCTASAWDFCNRMDFRIKECTEVTMDDLVSVHHEMSHVQYYMSYADQPYIYRDGANPAFHEAISNAIRLSVFNPHHFHRVGLFNNNSETYETNMNFLMTMALNKVAFIPYALLVDQWRFHVFRGGIQTMNSAWWDLRLRYQGIVPPAARNERQLDAAAKRHVIADIPYTRYYVALLLEFQIQEALCSAAGHTGQLYTCDIYRSREAGRILSEALKLGRSRHWRDVLRTITRGKQDRLSADAMLDYFQPLLMWLRIQNRAEKVIGWTTHKEDTSLFQPLLYKSSASAQSLYLYPLIAVIALKINLL
ncbi:PREDICTED: angiotensin-converting enzyme-like [Nicrophorus vespilloides]|uniref:Angiotensin-converting enzyme n=1 Tax=Nicrophorus vespilloides TaxID=110193 RepID=A0ABM1N8C9_NICVS|nr:PREDICTED: angiotensin-converting enzyme-like [Nicrophorus vespilloides]